MERVCASPKIGKGPNRLTPVYSKNYYEEENYLTVETVYLNT